jgi:hypothetical protein
MQYRLKRITGPAIEPVTVSDVKLYAHISHSVEDDIITSWIKTARKIAEDFLKRVFISQLWEMSFDSFPNVPFDIPISPLLQLRSIIYYGTDNTEYTLYYDGTNPVSTTEEGGDEPTTNSDFIIDLSGDPGRVALAYCKTWPTTELRSIDAVRIRFFSGYGLTAADVPDNIKDAIYLYCAYCNENRAGELPEIPRQFFDLLRFERV